MKGLCDFWEVENKGRKKFRSQLWVWNPGKGTDRVISVWVEELAAHAGQGGARRSKDQVEVLSQDGWVKSLG